MNPHEDYFKKFGIYPYLKVAVALAIILFVPFSIYAPNRVVEPYPAIILPGGAGVVTKNDSTFTYNAIQFYGFDQKSGAEILLDNRQIIQPIPTDRMRGMVRYSFNMDTVPVFGLRSALLGTSTYVTSQNERFEIWRWLNQNLVSQKAKPDSIIIRQVAKTVRFADEKIIEESITKERTLGKAE